MSQLWSNLPAWGHILFFVVGLVILIKGSDWFIEGAAAIAHHFKVSDAIIGLTLVSIGTSLPELATNVYASLANQGDVALGNVTGSNVANILLILGVSVTAMGVIDTDRVLFNRDTVVMMVVFVVFAGFCYYWDSEINRLEAVLLLLGFVAYMVYLVRHKEEVVAPVVEGEVEQAGAHVKTVWGAVLLLLIGMTMVVIGARLMVDNIVAIAEDLKIPKAVISATLIAFGTSVPELAVTLAGILKKKNDIAMGNIIGSNIFNLLLVMGTTAILAPVPVPEDVRLFILPTMLASGLALMLFMRTAWQLVRWEGIVFLACYVGFIGYNVILCLQQRGV